MTSLIVAGVGLALAAVPAAGDRGGNGRGGGQGSAVAVVADHGHGDGGGGFDGGPGYRGDGQANGGFDGGPGYRGDGRGGGRGDGRGRRHGHHRHGLTLGGAATAHGATPAPTRVTPAVSAPAASVPTALGSSVQPASRPRALQNGSSRTTAVTRDRPAAATRPVAGPIGAAPRRRRAATLTPAVAEAAGARSGLFAPVSIRPDAAIARENEAAIAPVDHAHSARLADATDSGVFQIIQRIPGWMWLVLALALAFALIAGALALWSGLHVRRQGELFAALSAAALTDPLTGALNRRGFTEAVERELARARRYGHPFVLAYIDVRGLKRVNDTEGHQAGDQLLKEAAQLLQDSARSDDVVGRLGGDEMALLLVEQTPAGAEVLTERLKSEVAARRATLGLSSPWALTVGTAAFPEDGDSFDRLLRTADQRLYEQRGIELHGAQPV